MARGEPGREATSDARSGVRPGDRHLFRRQPWLHRRLRSTQVRWDVPLDYIISLLVSVGLLGYLTFALLKPEKF